LIAGKVSKFGTFQHQQDLGFNIDIVQFAGTSNQNLHVCCYFLAGRCFHKTPIPWAGEHVIVHGIILRNEVDRCVVAIKEIALGRMQAIVAGLSSDSTPPSSSMSLQQFDWSAKHAKAKTETEGTAKDGKGKKRKR